MYIVCEVGVCPPDGKAGTASLCVCVCVLAETGSHYTVD